MLSMLGSGSAYTSNELVVEGCCQEEHHCGKENGVLASHLFVIYVPTHFQKGFTMAVGLGELRACFLKQQLSYVQGLAHLILKPFLSPRPTSSQRIKSLS